MSSAKPRFETNPRARLSRVVAALVVPSILILLVFNIAGIFIGLRTGAQPQAIQDGIRRNYPYILMANHTLLFLLLLRFMKQDRLSFADIGWKLDGGPRRFPLEVLIGVLAGGALYLVDRHVLAKAVNVLWSLLGGSSEPVSTDVTQGSSRFAWVIVATLFPGVVEESVFRGYGLTQLR